MRFREFLLQYFLFFLGLLVELGVPIFFSKSKQKKFVKALGFILILISISWLTLEVGLHLSSKDKGNSSETTNIIETWIEINKALVFSKGNLTITCDAVFPLLKEANFRIYSPDGNYEYFSLSVGKYHLSRKIKNNYYNLALLEVDSNRAKIAIKLVSSKNSSLE